MKKKFKIGDIVYLVTDPEQYQRMVTGIIERQTHFEYLLSCGADEETPHLDIEISTDKDYKK